jgi:hypothetical protein
MSASVQARAMAAVQALNDRENVAFSVLEPRRLRAAGAGDAARALLARHVVVLERTPRAFNSASSCSISSTCQNAWLANDVPAFGVGYRKHAVFSPNS